MAQTVLSSQKKPAADIRARAKALAQRSGMTFEQWLEAAMTGVEEHNAPAAGASRGPVHSSLAEIARKLAQKDQLASAPVHAGSGGSEATLSRRIAAGEKRIARLIEVLARRQENSEAHMAALIDAVLTVVARKGLVSGREEDSQERTVVHGLKDFQEQLGALEERLRSHFEELAPHKRFAIVDEKLELLAKQLSDPLLLSAALKGTADLRAQLHAFESHIAERLKPLEVGLARFPGEVEKLRLSVAGMAEETLAGRKNEAVFVQDISSRLDKALDGILALERGAAEQDIALDALQKQVAGLGDTLTHSLKDGLVSSGLPAIASELQQLFSDFRRLQDDPPGSTKQAIEALQTSIGQLTSRLSATEDMVRQYPHDVGTSFPAETMPVLFGRDRSDEDIAWAGELPSSLAGDPAREPVAEAFRPQVMARPSQVSVLGNETRSAFIAAARRATRAAAEANRALVQEKAQQEAGHSGSFYQRYRHCALLGLAAVMMLMGAVQSVRPSVVSAVLPVAQARSGLPSVKVDSGQGSFLFDQARKIEREATTGTALARAVDLYRLAAMQGYAPALLRLGIAYEVGRGVERDLRQAMEWYKRAAEKGMIAAMHNIAVLHARDGTDRQADYSEAAFWFRRAALGGHAASQYNYGVLAARGLGIPADKVEAYRFLGLAAEQGDAEAAALREELNRSLSGETGVAGT